MDIVFYKYQATGNDFVVIDNRNSGFDKENHSLIKYLCNRKFGIGADGLILLEDHYLNDFDMIYYNADGKPGSMCGNGSRCTVAFAHQLGIIESECTFNAYDGKHSAEILNKLGENLFNIKVSMNDVRDIELAQHVFLDTGSPHFVCFVDDVEQINIIDSGRAVRYNERFKEEGTNVDFVSVVNNELVIRTYERGVENETLSCGTGVTASAIAASEKQLLKNNGVVDVITKGGSLKVHYKKTDSYYTEIFLEGPAQKVFSGTVNSKVIKDNNMYA